MLSLVLRTELPEIVGPSCCPSNSVKVMKDIKNNKTVIVANKQSSTTGNKVITQ